MFRKGKISKSLQLLQKDGIALRKKVCMCVIRMQWRRKDPRTPRPRGLTYPQGFHARCKKISSF